jgi:hypothetical protein
MLCDRVPGYSERPAGARKSAPTERRVDWPGLSKPELRP